GVIDGQENPLSIIIASKFYEPNKHLTLTYHGFTPIVLLYSKAILDGYSEQDQKAIWEAARAGVLANRSYIDKLEEEGLKKLESEGVQVVREIDTSGMKSRIQPVY